MVESSKVPGTQLPEQRAERALRGYLLRALPAGERRELDDVARLAAGMLPAAAGAEMVAGRGSSVVPVAVSDEVCAQASRIRRACPVRCTDLLGERPVTSADLVAWPRWAEFLAVVRASTGLASFVSLPVTPVSRYAVSLLVWSTGPDPLAGADPERVRLAASLTRNLTHSLVLREQVENLELALESNRQIGAAIGILMARAGLTHQAAFGLLRRVSQDRNVKLRDLADEIVLIGQLPDT